MFKPNVYVLGAKPEIVITPEDLDGAFFVPSETRLTIKLPDTTLFTVSGAGLTNNGDSLSYQYKPTAIGYYQYEVWVKDSTGREDTAHHSFEVVDRVF